MAQPKRIIHAIFETPLEGLLPPSPPHSPRNTKKQQSAVICISAPPWHPAQNSIAWPAAWQILYSLMAPPTFKNNHSQRSEWTHDVLCLASPFQVNDDDDSIYAKALQPMFDSTQRSKSSQASARHAEKHVLPPQQYMDLMDTYADMIAQRYQSDRNSTIWIHDYALMLLPGMIRRKLPRANIGFTLHSRVPSASRWQEPEGKQILQSLAAADLIGLESPRSVHRFYTFCSSFNMSVPTTCILTPPPPATPSTAGPSTTHTSLSSAMVGQPSHLRQLFGHKCIVYCQDTDAAGVYKTLAGLEHFLSSNPDMRQRVVFLHVCLRADVPLSLEAVPDIVRQINQLYGTPESVPIHFYHQDIDAAELDALLHSAHVALVMGQMSAAQQPRSLDTFTKTRPLIVTTPSKISQSAVIVDHNDCVGIASVLLHALQPITTPQTFASELSQERLPRPLNPALLADAYVHARKRLLLFDYDGTLAPIVSNPDDARPTRQLLRYLQALCNDTRNVVWVVSGRDGATLEAWLGKIQHLGLSAEHGSFMKMPDSGDWIDMLANKPMGWKSKALEVFEKYAASTPGSVVEQKKSSITWHYRNALNPQHALEQLEACYSEMEELKQDVDILRGKMNLEVRSLLVNKGEVVKRIHQSVQPDFVLCAGDDRTDEDMFRALLPFSAAYSVSIGPRDKETLAGFCIDTSEEFVACLGSMAAAPCAL